MLPFHSRPDDSGSCTQDTPRMPREFFGSEKLGQRAASLFFADICHNFPSLLPPSNSPTFQFIISPITFFKESFPCGESKKSQLHINYQRNPRVSNPETYRQVASSSAGGLYSAMIRSISSRLSSNKRSMASGWIPRRIP